MQNEIIDAINPIKYNDNYMKYLGQLVILENLHREKFFSDAEERGMRKFLVNKYEKNKK